MDHILELWRRVVQARESAVLATVVKTQGSSYRLPGAHLVVTRTGERAGSVSGGCLEDDIVKKAWWLTENGPSIRRYDTTPDGEIATAGYGLGCNGTIDVLLERIRPGEWSVLDLAEQVKTTRRSACAAFLIEPRRALGQRLVVDAEGAVFHNVAESQVASVMEMRARETLSQGSSRRVAVENGEAFVEALLPAVRLAVFGAGDDAKPLAEIAKFLGWQVFVVDGRAHYATPERFPFADMVAVRRTGDSRTWMDPWTVAVIMNHSYSQDLEVLRELSEVSLRYLGLLGPRKRAIQLFEDAGLDERRLGPALHSPMGLDIGADGPEQVAVAVIAEIQATLNGRAGGPLRQRAGSIHSLEADAAELTQSWVHSIAYV
jgi:xanthine dehydrogenase accessory factor